MGYKFTVKDKALARRIEKLIAKDRAEKREARRIFRKSYAKRLSEFLRVSLRGHPVGFESWYGMTGSYLTGWGPEDDEKRAILTQGTKLQDSCKFHPVDLGKYFNPGEDVPCVMRGSVSAIRARYGKTYYALEVFERYLRRVKFTCYSENDWRDLLKSYDLDFPCGVVKRIWNHWGHNGPNTNSFDDSIRRMVTNNEDSHHCLVNGKKIWLDQEQYDAIISMQQIADKLGKIDDRCGTEKAA